MFTIIRKRTIADLERQIEQLRQSDHVSELERTRTRLEGQVRTLKEEVEDLKLKRKIEDEDIKHMVKMRLEAIEIEKQKALNEMERDLAEKVATVKDNYRDKLETFLQTKVTEMKEMQADILGRLPNVNVRLNGDI